MERLTRRENGEVCVIDRDNGFNMDATDAIIKALNKLADYEDAEENGLLVNKWIKDELPEENERVLVCCKTKKSVKSINLAYHVNGYWHGQGSMSGVIAWMPLPELPKEANDEQQTAFI